MSRWIDRTRTRMGLMGLAGIVLAGGAYAVAADGPARPSLEKIKSMVASMNAETRVEKVDHERLVVRRLDVVDENGVIRMSLGRNEAVMDGISYKRSIPVSGLLMYDDKGSERGGFAYSPANGGTVLFAMDHPAKDATGWRVSADGSVEFLMVEAPPLLREPALGNKLVPGVASPQRLTIKVSADGTPLIELADKQAKPRVRLTVNQEGFGALEFLDASGAVIDTFAPGTGKSGSTK